MCGILAIIGNGMDQELVKSLSKRMAHRGPDESDMIITENGSILSHERLSIIDLYSGKQPIKGSIACMPELENDNVLLCKGICSDYIQYYR